MAGGAAVSPLFPGLKGSSDSILSNRLDVLRSYFPLAVDDLART